MSMSDVSGHRWEEASGPSRLTITRQIGDRFLIYQTCVASYQRIANWDGFVGVDSARRWIRSLRWTSETEVVEN